MSHVKDRVWAATAMLALNLSLAIAHAGEWQLAVASRHMGDSPESLTRELDREADAYILAHGQTPYSVARGDAYHEINPGVIYHTDAGWYAGAYRNSEGGGSFAAGRSWDLTNRLSVSLGLVTGYDDAPVLPQIGVHYDVGMIRLSAVPYTTSAGVRVDLVERPNLGYTAERDGWGVVLLASVVFGG